jgi:hypothetical protein
MSIGKIRMLDGLVYTHFFVQQKHLFKCKLTSVALQNGYTFSVATSAISENVKKCSVPLTA